jgi:hypothetical protein
MQRQVIHFRDLRVGDVAFYAKESIYSMLIKIGSPGDKISYTWCYFHYGAGSIDCINEEFNSPDETWNHELWELISPT